MVSHKKIGRAIIVLSLNLAFTSCSRQQVLKNIQQQTLFEIQYGSFEDEIQLLGQGSYSPTSAKIQMKDGFFFVADSYAQKIMEFTSFGDLTEIIYNPNTNPAPSFTKKIGKSEESSQIKNATQTAHEFNFNSIKKIAVDSQKNIFVADTISTERQETDTKNKMYLTEIVRNFSNNGAYIGYYGQEGFGGTPFPTIKDIFSNKDNELIVICITNEENIVFWFSQNGSLKWKIPIKTSFLPDFASDEEKNQYFCTIDRIVPDFTEQKIYIKADYYKTAIDSELGVQSGIDFERTVLHEFNIKTETFDLSIEIPPYDDVVTDRFTKLSYKVPYEFLGVTESKNFFFCTPTDAGFVIQIIQPNNQHAIKRQIKYDTKNSICADFNLTEDGIIFGLLSKEDKNEVIWWRLDSILEKKINL